jgi:hypothetical protein
MRRYIRLFIYYLAVGVLGVSCACSFCMAAETENLQTQDKIIATSIKALAKALVTVENKDQLEKRIQAMSDEKFQMRYVEFQRVMHDYPGFMTKYDFPKELSKRQAAEKFMGYDRSKLYGMIDSIPDEAIANSFRRYLNQHKQALEKSDIAQQIRQIWKHVLGI